MNVKEMKKLAGDWMATYPGTKLYTVSAKAMHDAIVALPDDYQLVDVNKVIEGHQDLVEMAEALPSFGYDRRSEAMRLARAVIERFGKREPRRFDVWAVIKGGEYYYGFSKEEQARAFLKEAADSDLRLARLTGTEEV